MIPSDGSHNDTASQSGVRAAVREAPRRVERTLTRAEFERYSPTIRRTATLLARRVQRSVSVADLTARGFTGLFDALMSASTLPEGVNLDDYVLHRVRAAMIDYVTGLDASVQKTRRESRLLARAIRVLEATLQRAPDRGEISAALSLDLAAYEAMLERIHKGGLARLDVLGFDQPEDMGPADVGPPAADSLAEAVSRLPQEDRDLLMLLYEQDCSMAEAAAVLGRSEPRAAMLFTEAVHRLRAALGKE